MICYKNKVTASNLVLIFLFFISSASSIFIRINQRPPRAIQKINLVKLKLLVYLC